MLLVFRPNLARNKSMSVTKAVNGRFRKCSQCANGRNMVSLAQW